jgi:hypothetical protein
MRNLIWRVFLALTFGCGEKNSAADDTGESDADTDSDADAGTDTGSVTDTGSDTDTGDTGEAPVEIAPC